MSYEKRKRKAGSEPAGVADARSKFTGKSKYLNPYLSDQDKSWLDDNSDSLFDRVADTIDSIADEYALRVSFDNHSQRYLATLTCLLDNVPNTGFILAVRGATPFDALFALHYLHHVKSEGLWRSITPETTAPTRWG